MQLCGLPVSLPWLPLDVTSEDPTVPAVLIEAQIRGQIRFKFATAALVALVGLISLSCSKSVDFSALRKANRIDVRTSSDEPVKVIADPKQIKIAVDFISNHPGG